MTTSLKPATAMPSISTRKRKLRSGSLRAMVAAPWEVRPSKSSAGVGSMQREYSRNSNASRPNEFGPTELGHHEGSQRVANPERKIARERQRASSTAGQYIGAPRRVSCIGCARVEAGYARALRSGAACTIGRRHHMYRTHARNHRLFLRIASSRAVALVVCALLATGVQAQGFRHGVQDTLGPLYRDNPYAQRADRRPSSHDTSPRGMVRHWNEVAIDASGLDHTPVADGETRVFGEQLGPARASRAMAIVHIAIFDAVNAISGRYRSYTGLPAAPRGTSMEAAIA